MRRIAVVACAVLLAVGGCSTEEGSSQTHDGVSVNGEPYTRPTVTFTPPLQLAQPRTEIIWDGEGEPLKDGDQLLVNYRALNSATGDVIGDTYQSGPQSWLVNDGLDGFIYSAIKGKKLGSRVLQLSPGETGLKEGSTKTSSTTGIVVVFDLISNRARGQEVTPRKGLPTVTLADNGAPKVAIPKGVTEPTYLVVQPLIKGTGPQVQTGNLITIQYTKVKWGGGKVVDSTWEDGRQPLTVPIGAGKMTEGLDDGLLDQTVGSQILLIVPDSYGVPGEGTMVFVVDILSATDPNLAEPTPTPSTVPAASSSATSES